MANRRVSLVRTTLHLLVLVALAACGSTDPPALGDGGPSAAARLPRTLSVLIEPSGPHYLLPGEGFGRAVAISGARVAIADYADFDSMGFNLAHVDTFELGEGGAAATGTVPGTGIGSVERCFGRTIALSGDLLAVAEPCAAGGAGTVHSYHLVNGAWSEEPLLAPPPEAGAALFGQALALAANRMVVGAPYAANGPATSAGAAYVYNRVGGAWRFAGRLAPADARAYDTFGMSVTMSAATIAVGAPGRGTGGVAFGRVTLFALQPDGTWAEGESLAVSDGFENETTAKELALCSGTLFVSGSGADWPAVHLFAATTAGWVEGDLAEPPGAVLPLSWVDGLACAGDTLIVGMPYASPPDGRWTGMARLYKKLGGAWTRTGEINGGTAGDRAGHAVAIDNGIAVVGAPNASVGGRPLGTVRVVR